jgi:RNA polymerase sigma factor (sigma-70 family)
MRRTRPKDRRAKKNGQTAPPAAAPVSRRSELAYIRKIREGDRNASEEFVRMNQGLVVSLASKYAFTRDALPDLIAEGNMGLLRAIVKFKTEKHTKFSTYAYFWIKRFILRSLMTTNSVFKVPEKVQELKDRYNQFIQKSKLERNESPTDAQIAAALHLELRLFLKYKAYFKSFTMSQTASNDDEEPVDVLDLQDMDEHRTTLSTLLQDREILDRIFERLQAKEKRAKIGMWLEVLKYHFGLIDGTPYSYNEIAEKKAISRQRVHQIIKVCLYKLQQEFKEMKNEGII